MVINSPDHKFNKLAHYTIIGLILLLAFFLRTYQLDHQALRGDEAATVLYSAMPISELWELSRVTDPHPPLYYLLLHPWQALIGEEAWAMRFVGVIAGTLTVAALYGLAQRTLHNTAVSLLAAGLLAVNPLQIWLAQDVRSYPLFTLLGLLSSWALWAALTGGQPSAVSRQPSGINRELQSLANTSPQQPTPYRPTRRVSHPFLWLLYIGLTVACLYTHYYTVFLIAFQGLFVLINAKKFWQQKWPWSISQIAIALLIIPGLQLAYNFIGPAAGGIEKIPTTNILRLASTALLTGFTIDDHWGLLISLILTPIWLFGIASLLRQNFTTGTFWTLFFATPVLGVIILSIDRPFFKERFLIQAQPAFELLLAAGLTTLFFSAKMPLSRSRSTRRAPRTVSSVLRATSLLFLTFLLYVNLLTLTNYFSDIAYAKAPPWHLYRNYVSAKAQPGDVMLTNFPEASVSYYSPNGLPFYVVPVERDRSTEFRLAETEKIANAYQRIWFLPLLRQGFDEQGDVLNWLDRHADRIDQVFFPVYNLNLYLGPAAIDERLIQQSVKFAHGIELRGFQILDKSGQSRLVSTGETGREYRLDLEPEDEFTLSLYWLAGGPTEAPYTVFTHLIAADEFNRVGQDNQPVWGTFPTTAWSPGEKITDKYTLTIPPGTPPGDHHLQIGWYQSETQARMPVLDNAGHPGEEFVILNAIIRVEQRSSLAKD